MLCAARYFFRMTTAAAVAVFAANLAYGELVLHHGFDADSDGSVSYCASCHDGVIAKNVAFCEGNCSPGQSHSVLKRYPPFGKERFFLPASFVAAQGIKLPEGKTACISCHNLNNQNRKHLAVDNQGSRLCLSCHIK